MRCTEFDQLLDAYLDGELSSSLRIEFDAHRLHCAHCRRVVAMMESIGSVVASDRGGPRLRADFTDSLMAALAEKQPAIDTARARRWRVWTAAFALPAAAALGLAVLTQRPAPTDSSNDLVDVASLRGAPAPADVPMKGPDAHVPRAVTPAALAARAELAGKERIAEITPRDEAQARAAVRAIVLDQLHERFWDAYAAGNDLTRDFVQLGEYLRITLPDDLTRATNQLVLSEPVMGLIQALIPAAVEPGPAPEEEMPATGAHVFEL